MSLKLSKISYPPYDYYSTDSVGPGPNPITTTDLILDYTTPEKWSDVLIIYLVATENIYTNISLSILYEEMGLNWFVSYDNINWYKTISLTNMDARNINIIRPIYFKSGMLNDGTVIDGQHFQCKVNIGAKEIIK